MRKYDVLIVGGGISGCMLVWRWLLSGKSVCLIADLQPGSSHVAAGVYNPVVLKRFTPVWNALEQIHSLDSLSQQIEDTLEEELYTHLPILRRFHNDNEKKAWVKKTARPDLIPFLGPILDDVHIKGLNNPFGFGQTMHTGFLDCGKFIEGTLGFQNQDFNFVQGSFDYDQLEYLDDGIRYGNLESEQIVFSEGTGIRKNPFFSHIQLQGNKGETIIVRIPGLQLPFILKGSVFVMPFKNDLFWVGATYAREFTDAEPTQDALSFLTSRLEQIISLPYEIVEHKAGIRPTTSDRRPIVGTHPKYNRVHIFNGMGSRSVLITPWASQLLYDNIYKDRKLPSEMNVARFTQPT